MTQTPPETPARPSLPPELDPRRPRPGSPPPGRGRVRRILGWTAIVLSAVVLVSSVGLYVAFQYYNGRIARVPIRIPGHSAPPAAADGKAQNYLIVGSDTRAGPGNGGFGSVKKISGQRSDTVILVHIPSGDAKATIISFPRDSWVTIPAFKDTPEHKQRINSAISIGGPPLLVETIERLSGLRVDHYLQVTFGGFKSMVNALGGVTVCVKTTRRDKDSKDFLTAGTHHVNGDQALAFVRDRKGLPRGDIDRIANQQYFLSVLLHKVLSAGTLANPLRINAFLRAATSSLAADPDLGIGDLRTLALRMRSLDAKHVSLVTVPIKDTNARINGADVVLLDDAKLGALFDRLKGNEAASSPTPPPPSNLTVAPSDISVGVYNAAGSSGLATRGASDLQRVGFTVSGLHNRITGATQTVVRYGPGQSEAARTLAAAVPGATTQAVSALGNDLEIVLGSDYAGARAVAVGGLPSPATPKPGTSGGSDGLTAADAARSCAP